jgi:hypothetical protein
VKRTGVILFLLLSATSTAVSQALRLDVENKPLSRVLNMLDVEISFDDRALSAYDVSISKTFGDAEEALSWLLRDKPFRIEKTGSVYVLVPADAGNREGNGATFDVTPARRAVFRGTVIDRTTREPLEYATVSLLDAGNNPVTTAVTTGEGNFLIGLPVSHRQKGGQRDSAGYLLKISYLGYETLLAETGNPDEEPGVFALKATVFQLDETVVTAGNVQPGISRTRYVVTPQMCNGVTNVLELSDKIPGLSFDKTSETVRLNHHSNILFLVDGIQYPYAYLKHLSPHRIHAIEIIHAPSGRFVSDDYAAIVHFILKKDYTGYDIHVSEVASLNLSQTAGGNRWTENRTETGMTYVTRKLNMYGTYSYDRESRNMISDKYVKYNHFELASIPAERPNNSYEDEINTVTGGLNYHITPLQLAGIQADYTSGNTFTRQEYTMRRTDLTQNHNRILTNVTENLTKVHAFTGSLFYRGQPAKRIHLYGDFSYNYYYNLIGNEYCQDETANYRYVDLYDEYKNQTVFNLEGKFLLSGNMQAEAGYSGIWRRYASGSSQGKGFLDYGESRNKAFVYLSYYPSDKTGLKTGIALEHIKRRDRNAGESYFRVLPYLQFNYRISRTASLLASYATNQSYPALYQLSPMSIVIDTFLTQTGNPALKSAVRHNAFVELTLWNSLKVTPQFSFIRDGISEVYDNMGYKLYRTFNNMDMSEYCLHASHDQMLGVHFRLKNAIMLYHSEAMHDGVRSSLNGWILRSEANFYHPGMAVGAQMGYCRNMRKYILWQGSQMSDRDYWCVSIQKELWHKRISVMMSYIPPVSFGVRRERTKEMNTPLYREKTTLDLNSYNQMLLLKVSVRFEGGGIKTPAGKRIIIRNDEREK